MTGAFFVIAFRIHSSLARVIVENEKHDKKKREGMAFKKLGRINPRINPPSAYFNTRFCFYYILLGRNWKSRIYIFLFFPYISSIYIYIYYT